MLYRKFISLCILCLALLGVLTACSLPRVTAEQRLFRDISLDFLGEYQLPSITFENTQVGGLSGITYDRQRDRVYALSDDRGDFGSARFYTLKLDLQADSTGTPQLQNIAVEKVTLLQTEDGKPYPKGTINPEGIALSPQNSVFVSSEGSTTQNILPFIGEFDLATGQHRQYLPLPKRYLPDPTGEQEQGIPENLGFEALTLSPGNNLEPFRLFTATESALLQDRDLTPSEQGTNNRFLHYLIGDTQPVLISEHLYPMDMNPRWSVVNGLTELTALDQGGIFLSLERSLGFKGYGAKLFQIATGAATDTSSIASLKGDLSGVEPIRKKLVLDLNDLGIRLDNLEGMTLGPRLPDGTQSLLLVSDNNFSEAQVTQFLLFRLNLA